MAAARRDPDPVILRRDLLGALIAAIAAPATFAQKAARRVALVPAGPIGPRKHQWDAFIDEMRKLGWREGRNIEYAWSVPEREGEPFERYVEQALGTGADAIVVSTTAQMLAAKARTQALPIVGVSMTDPIGSGLAKSLAQPGGNVTGVSLRTVDLSGKRVEALREAFPRLRRLAHVSPRGTEAQYEAAQPVLKAAGISATHYRVGSVREIHEAIEQAAKERLEAAMISGHPFSYGPRREIAESALRAGLPIMGTFSVQAKDGFLLTYGTDDTENYRRAATHAHRILNGARPGDLPIEQIDRVTLCVNLRTARTLGVKLPHSLLVRADETFQ